MPMLPGSSLPPAKAIEAPDVLNALVASGRFRVAVVKKGLAKVVHKEGPGQLALMRVAEDGGLVLLRLE